MTDREKLIELISYFCEHMPHEDGQTWEEACAVHLLTNGVTFAKDTDVPSKWNPASIPPKEPMEYIVMIKGAANATTLLWDGVSWFEEDAEGWRTYHRVTHWMPLPLPPKSYAAN